MEPQAPQAKEGRQMIPLAIVAAGALIAGAIYFGGKPSTVTSLTNGTNTANNAAAAGVVAPVTSKDHVLGNPSTAKLVIVEYSDLECPFCKVFHNTMHQVMDTYKGQVAWVFRQFPIAQLHSKAPNEAQASECAAQLGGNDSFWKFIDGVFAATGSNNTLDPTQLPKIAGDIGLDVTAFNKCLSTGQFAQTITDDVTAAVKAGAQGTPYSIIITKDGKKLPINGAQPFDVVKAQIDALLK
jgi:protein-disulfide isomerase